MIPLAPLNDWKWYQYICVEIAHIREREREEKRRVGVRQALPLGKDATSPKCIVTNFTVAHVILCWKAYGLTMSLNQPPLLRSTLTRLIENRFLS
jgi:hypothetical protein